MTTELIEGLILGALIMLFMVFLFRDLFLRKVFSRAVPMVQDKLTGDLLEIEEYMSLTEKRRREDMCQNYKLLILVRTTLKFILLTCETDKELEDILYERLSDIETVVYDHERLFKKLGIDIESIVGSSEFDKALEDLEKENRKSKKENKEIF